MGISAAGLRTRPTAYMGLDLLLFRFENYSLLIAFITCLIHFFSKVQIINFGKYDDEEEADDGDGG